MTKRVKCEYCKKNATQWVGEIAEPICDRAVCKGRALKRHVKITPITKEEHEIYGEE